MKHLPLITTLAISTAGPAAADVFVRFIEGAPKDRFEIVSDTGVCTDSALEFVLDLTGSAGKLIFDVTERGAGVEVYQPFELVTGVQRVIGTPKVADGDKMLSMVLDRMPAGSEVAFTIDVDDTIGAREITVARSEIVGARAVLRSGGVEASATFDESATAQVNWADCPA
ncbi:MAG: hypothetical protein AAF222_13060 [Pseudomonadota bacterium]